MNRRQGRKQRSSPWNLSIGFSRVIRFKVWVSTRMDRIEIKNSRATRKNVIERSSRRCHFTFADPELEESFSRRSGRANLAKYGVAARQSRRPTFRCSEVMPYGSSGGGRNVIGK